MTKRNKGVIGNTLTSSINKERNALPLHVQPVLGITTAIVVVVALVGSFFLYFVCSTQSLVCRTFLINQKSFLIPSAIVSASPSAMDNLQATHSSLSSLLLSKSSRFWRTHHGFEHLRSSSSYTTLPFWGSYRPGIYFGLKTRAAQPVSLATGIMWARAGMRGPEGDFRHDTSSGEITRFQWLQHDGKSYGLENIIDRTHGVEINASFVVLPLGSLSTSSSSSTAGIAGGEPVWAQRLSVSADTSTSMIFYFGLECSDSAGVKLVQCLSLGDLNSLRMLSMSEDADAEEKDSKNGKRHFGDLIDLEFISV